MNNQNGFDESNIFGDEDILSQGLADSTKLVNADSNQNPNEGNFIDPLLNEPLNFTTTETSSSGLGLELFELSSQSAARSNNDPDSSSSNDTFTGEVLAESESGNDFDYAIFAEGQLTLKGQSDFDGDPLIATDDAYIYAAEGFEFKSNQTFPILRDDLGEPILDGDGNQQLLDNAVVVTDGYSQAKAKNNNLSGLIPPQTVEPQTLEVPAYTDIVTSVLDSRIPPGTEPVIFNAKQNKIKNAGDWNSLFPEGGTIENPTYVRVTEDKLEIPNNVDLSNYTIVVEQDDIKFKGSNNDLDNVLLLAEDGKLEAKKVNANNTTFLASDKIEIKSQSQFTGENLIANGSGKIEFKSKVTTPNETDSLRVISAEDLELKSQSEIRGQLLASEDLTVKSQSTFYGSIGAKNDIDFNSKVEVYGVPSEPETEITATIDSVAVDEGNGGEPTTATLNVTLSESSTSAVSVDYATSDDTAIAGSDYTADSGTLTFAPGETEKSIEIAIAGDNIDEGDEAFEVELSNPNGITLGNDKGTVNIQDDDNPPEIAIDSLNVGEASGTAEFTVSLNSASSFPVTVDFSTVDGSAVAGSDYIANSGTVTFEPGQTSKTIAVEISNDELYENAEAFAVELSNPNNATIAVAEGAVTIEDDDELPGVAVGDTTVVEGDDGTTTANFVVTLSAASGVEVSLDYATADGSAEAGSDYVARTGTITFAPGETSKTVEVEVLGDILDENSEAFTLQLTNPSNASLETTEITVTIEDNDAPPIAEIANISLNEGKVGTTDAELTVTLDNPSGKEITIDYATENDSAVAGEDYTATTGTITFEPGETSKTIAIPVTGDDVFEGDEAFKVNLSNPNNVVISEEFGIATVTIANDDTPALRINFNLANDTGVDNTDKITNDATITGNIENIQENVVLNASMADGEAIDKSDLVQPDGSFTLGIEDLEEINGGDLGDGTYTLNLAVTDDGNNTVAERELIFTLDTAAPSLELTVPLADGNHSNNPRLIGEVGDNSANLSYSLDGSANKDLAVNDTGNFDTSLGEGLDAGTHNVTVIATDVAGNQNSQEVSFQVGDKFFTPDDTNGWGAVNESTVVLGERDSYVVQTEVPVELGLDVNEEGEEVGTRTISLDLDAVWDETDTKDIEDQLLVYLVDPANPSQTLLDNGTPGTPVFSVAGEQSDFTPGLVSFDGTTVTIDASSLTDLDEGLLVFQLLNQDNDTGSVVTVNNLTSTTDIEGFINPIFPQDNDVVAAGGELNLANLNEASDVETVIGNVSFDAETGEYKALVSIANNGEAAISRNSAIIFNNLPDGVELSSPSGIDSEGNPYINLRPGIGSGGLEAGETSQPVEIVLTNPNLIRFGLDTTVLVGSSNVAPVFEPIEPLTVIPGEKLEFNLAATDANGDNITYRLDSDGDLPTGVLEGDGTLKFNPKPDEIGSYEFTIIASDGVEEVSQTGTIDVVADPVTTTRISGVIENVEQEPLAGVPIELGELSTVTAGDGSFTIETDQPLTADTLIIRGEEIAGDLVYPYIAEKLPLVLGQQVYEGFHNTIDRPIYLPALDVDSGQEIDPTVDTTITSENIPGSSVFVEAGSLSTQDGEDFTGTLSITEVPNDLTPAALPENLSPDMVVTIQPGEMAFNTPAPLSLPNLSNYAPGTEMDLWSINPETGDFDNVGMGIVSDDGSVVETVDGGIRNSSWHFFAPPPEGVSNNTPPPTCNECQSTAAFKSEVELNTGAVIEDYDLVSYSSNGESRGVTLTYDSLRADPRPIVQFGYDDLDPSSLAPGFTDKLRIMADWNIKGNDGFDYQVPGFAGGQYGLNGGEHFWSLSNKTGDVNFSLQADLSSQDSGKYDYTLTSGVRLFVRNQFVGSSSNSESYLLHVNSVDSAFGSGWGIAGWQEIIENNDGSLLLIDGDGSELLFEAPETDNEPYIAPPGDFSVVEKLPDGTFRRTTTDQMVYTFNQNHKLQSVTDTNSNTTEYIYDESERLTKIIDPVGLETLFAYNDLGKVSSITDPANKQTLMEYDQFGNLIAVTNPDDSTSSWSYDDGHHMISEVDPMGNVSQASYDQFGRATSATQKDGSVVKVDPVQTQGLYPNEATANPLTAPQVFEDNAELTGTYADANGNVVQSELDAFGQRIGAVDGGGNMDTVERNESNLITSRTDAKGFETNYTYDERGNVLTIEDTLTFVSDIGGNALIINGIEESSEPELSQNATEAVDLLLQSSVNLTTIVNDIPDNITDYDLVWDLRFDNSSAISESQNEQYLDFLQQGGNLFLTGENSVFATRNDSILNLIESAGGGELEFALTSPNQQVLAPFTSPNPDSDSILYEAPGGVTNPGTGQFVSTDEENRGAGVTFSKGSLGNAEAGELTAIFDLNFFESIDDNSELQRFFGILTEVDNTLAQRSYTYDSIFNKLTSETDELDRQTLYDIDPNNGNLLATTQVVGEVGGDDDVTTSYTYTDAGLIDTMTDPLGRVTDYDYDAFGNLISEIYAVGTVDKASVSYEYDASGNQTATIDENGNRTEFEYDGLNRLIKTTYAVGTPTEAVETTEYDGNGNQIATVDGNGNRTEYEYDEKDRLIKTIFPDPDGEGELTSPISTSTYDGVDNLIATTDPLGRETRYVYDSRNRLVETILPDGTSRSSKYDRENNLTGTTDAAGETTRQVYDSRDRLIGEVDPQGNITRYEYDAADQLVAVIDGNDNRTEYEYDELGRQIAVIDGEGNITRTEYDKAGNVVATIDGNGNRAEYQYDERERNTTVTDAENGTTTTEYDDAGNVISETDQLNRTTTYQYDSRNRQTEITDPLFHTTSYEYDDLSNVTQVTDANNHSTSFTFDGLNRQTITTNELGDTTTNTYDALGNLIATTDELGRTTTYTYDELNRQIAVTDPNGNTTRTEYDERGNVTATVEANGDRTETQYDELNRQIATVDANGQTTSYEYDAVGNLLSITDPEENVTTYAYDEANRRVSDTNQLDDSRSYEYDAAGNLIKTTDRNGRVITYNFDKLNRSTTEVWLDENDNPIRTFNYNYDKASQLISVDDSDSAYAYVYDLNGRLIEVDNAGTPGVPDVVFNYDYDPVGNLLSVTDTINGEVKGTETFTHDELNRVTRITQSGNDVADKRVDIDYDSASQMTSMSRYSDLAGTNLIAESNYTYDRFGRLTDLNHESEIDVLANYNWVYDETNRLTQYTSPDGTANYTYDDIDQITGADYDYQSDESYTYDDNGNRTNDGYVTGENNQLLSDGTYNYEYDPEGNRVRRIEIATGIVTEYQWDYRNRLTGVETFDSDGNVISDSDYTYDVNNKRIAKLVDADGEGSQGAIEERFILDGDHIALTFDGEGNLTERFLHGSQVDQIIAQENVGGEVLWALADHQGSVKMLLDNDGNAVNNITYDAFGNITVESNPDVSFRFGYTGREHDEETGLDYYGARYRDSGVGRFISEDTIGFGGGDFNLYRYTFNSPLNYTDPDGNFALPVVAVGAIAVVGVVGIWYFTNEFQKLLEPPGTVVDFPPYVPPTAENTDDEEDRKPVPPPNPKPKPIPFPIPQPDKPDPKEDECEDECERYRDFAHGSSLESINSIKANGISNQGRQERTRGGRVNRPGFYTIELTQQDGNTVSEKLSEAYRFGQLAYREDFNSPTAVLIMQLCDDIYQELATTGRVFTRPIAGAEEFTETVFKPESFGTLNKHATFPQTIIPR